MNKTELLSDLAAKGLRVINVEQQSDAVKEAAGVNSYIAHIMEQRRDVATGRNIGFYVMDEGQPGETALYRDTPNQKNIAYDAMKSYLSGLIPATYIRGNIVLLNEETKDGIAEVYKDNGDGTASKIQILVYKNGSDPITHRELR